MKEVKFIDYIKHRIVKSANEPNSSFERFMNELKLMLPELEGPRIETGQDVLNRIVFRYRHDPWMRNNIGILVNAYRASRKNKDIENISIRNARNPFI